jgi:hypothetical protein
MRALDPPQRQLQLLDTGTETTSKRFPNVHIQHFQTVCLPLKAENVVYVSQPLNNSPMLERQQQTNESILCFFRFPPLHLSLGTYALADEPNCRHVVCHVSVANLTNLFVKIEILTAEFAFNKKPTRLDFWFCLSTFFGSVLKSINMISVLILKINI